MMVTKDDAPIASNTNSGELDSLSREELIDLIRKTNDRLDVVISKTDDHSCAGSLQEVKRVLESTNCREQNLSDDIDVTASSQSVALLSNRGASKALDVDEGNTTTEDESIRNLTRDLRYEHVRVGIGVLVRDPHHPTHVFAGTRRGSHGAGTLALPGGHLEKFESWEECATREVMEETGLKVEGVQFGHVTNDTMRKEGKHYVTIFVMCDCVEEDGRKQVPENLEPEKCDGWGSYSWDDLRKRLDPEESEGKASLFGPLRRLVEDSPDEILQFLER